MNMRWAIAIAACAAVPPTAASAASPYLEFSPGAGVAGHFDIAGAVVPKYELEPGYQVNLAVGVDFGTHFRIEAEALYLDTAIDTNGAGEATLETYGGFANAVYAPSLGRDARFRPFVVAGIGFTNVEIDAERNPIINSEELQGLAWQLKAGAEYEVAPNVAVTGGYRYMQIDLDEDTIEADTLVHSATLGVRFKTRSY